MYTDKIILAFAFIIFAAIAFIIIYATFIKPDQNTFNVPDNVKPPDPEHVKNTVQNQVGSIALRGAATVTKQMKSMLSATASGAPAAE